MYFRIIGVKPTSGGCSRLHPQPDDASDDVVCLVIESANLVTEYEEQCDRDLRIPPKISVLHKFGSYNFFPRTSKSTVALVNAHVAVTMLKI